MSAKKVVQMETDFPRGGVKRKSKKNTLSEPVADLFKTDEAEASSELDTKTKKKHKTTPHKQDIPKKKKKILISPILKETSNNAEKLRFTDLDKDMHILGCVARVDEYSMTFDLPGGLHGEVSITRISDTYTEQLTRLTNKDDDDDDDDEEEIAHLSDMFHPGMILPCRVLAIKIRAGSRKKIFISINPEFVNKDVLSSHLKEGMTMSGSVKACEDHGYEVDLGVAGVTAFLSRKHAEKYIKQVNDNNALNVGQVVRCCVLSVGSRVVRVGINPQQVDKAQLPRKSELKMEAVVSGMKVSGTVKEVLKDGLCVDVSGHLCYVHRSHTTQYKHRKAFNVGDQVTGTVLYTMSDNKTIYLSLLPHLTGSTCSTVYKKCSALADKKTPHNMRVLDVLKKAVYFKMGEDIRALATRANLSAVTDFKVPLHKTLRFGDTYSCIVYGFNLIESVALVRVQRSSAAKESGVDVSISMSESAVGKSPSLKRKAEGSVDVQSVKSKSDNKEPVSKKKKLESGGGLSKSEKKKGESVKNTKRTSGEKKLKTSGSVEMDSANNKKEKRKKQKAEEISTEVESETFTGDEEVRTKRKSSDAQVSTESKKTKKVKKEKSFSEAETSKKKKKAKTKKKSEEEEEEMEEEEGEGDKSPEECDSGVDMNKLSDSNDEDDLEVRQVGLNPPRLSVSAGFSWSEDFPAIPSTSCVDSSSDDDTEDKEPVKKTSQELRRERMEEEKKIYTYERQQLEGDQIPVTSEDFDRLVLQSPDSSVVWTRYMAFHLETVEIEKARAVAERALKTISFREDQEKLNMWVALLNLENLYGGEDQLRAVFDRAVQQNEPIKVYKQMVQIYISSGKMEEGEKLYNTMCKKFSQDKSVWTGFGLFFFKNNRLEPARKVLQRCLKCLDKREHVDMISKFAQLEYKYGESQRGCTMFENVLSNYPKRTDLWSVYLDMVIKTGIVDDVRSLFERVIHMKMSSKKMQFFFKKYMEFEKKHGNPQSVEKVKQKAVEYVESMG